MRLTGTAVPGERPMIHFGLKRLMDVVIASLLSLVLSPFIVLIAALVRLETPGGVIYRHRRIGKDGKPFDLYKFRTMSAGGDDKGYMQYLQQLIESERGGNGGGLPYQKMNGDGRITRIGKFIRNYYLDELPQLWNVVRGEMSLVGPRPHVQFEVDYYTPEHCRRLAVRPGLTGLWQVEGKADCTFNELIELDLEYIDHWSLALDIQILLKTAGLMARGGEGFWARMSKRVPKRRGKRFGVGFSAREGRVKPVNQLQEGTNEEEI